MDIRKIKKLIEMLEESQLNEIEISEGEESIRLSRGSTPYTGSAGPGVFATPAPLPTVPPAYIPDETGVTITEPPETSNEAGACSHLWSAPSTPLPILNPSPTSKLGAASPWAIRCA